MDDALALTYAVDQAAADHGRRRYGMRLLRADEGGLAPDFPDAESMLADAVEAIQAAGFVPGRDAALAIEAETHLPIARQLG
jgi:enolase